MRAMTSRTTLSLLEEQVQQRPSAIAYRVRDGGAWATVTWRRFHDDVRALAAAFVARGLGAGERVAIAASTSLAWLLCDFATVAAGGVPVAVPAGLTTSQTLAILRHAGARFALVEDGREATRLSELGCEAVLLRARADGAPSVAAHTTIDALVQEGRGLFAEVGAELDARSAALSPGDPAAIIYTSGTTGEPKGVVLTHTNFVFEVAQMGELLGVGPADEQLLFLPLSHVFGKILAVAAVRVGASSAIASSILTALEEAESAKPTFFGTVPRILEKVYELAESKSREAGAVQRRIYEWAIELGHEVARRRREGEEVPLALELQHRYADKLVFSKIRARFGGKTRFRLSGGAPLDARLAEWFHAIGVLVLEGYGLTETTAAATVNRPQAYRFGTVGRPIPGVEVTTASDGELLIRGPSVMLRYHASPDETTEAIDEQGFLHTGDVGAIDGDGFVRITDRKKDVLVTAGGKNVAPQPIEALLVRSPLIARAVVLGDRRPHLCALLAVDEPAVRAQLPELAGVPEGEAHRDPRVHARLQREIDAVNAELASFQHVRKFAILPEDLSVERGELTPTLKVRRRAVEQRNATLLDELYQR
jgi:long-chain acyl-CoA synthetase